MLAFVAGTEIVQGAVIHIDVPEGAQSGDILSLFVAATQRSTRQRAECRIVNAFGKQRQVQPRRVRFGAYGGGDVRNRIAGCQQRPAAVNIVRGAGAGHSIPRQHEAGSSGSTPASSSPGDAGVLDYRAGLLLTYVAAIPDAGTSGVTLDETTTICDDTVTQASGADNRPALTIGWAAQPFADPQPTVEFETSDSGDANWVFVSRGFYVEFGSSADDGTEVTNAVVAVSSPRPTLIWQTQSQTSTGGMPTGSLTAGATEPSPSTTASGWDLWIDVWATRTGYGVPTER